MQILAKAVGRRKEAVAQIQIMKGTGKFIINNKPAQQYLQSNACALIAIKSPFLLCQLSPEGIAYSGSNLISDGFPVAESIQQTEVKSPNKILTASGGKPSTGIGKIGKNNIKNLPVMDTISVKDSLVSKGELIEVQELPSLSLLAKLDTASQKSESPLKESIESTKIQTSSLALQLNFDQIDTIVKVKGGGLMGQTDAIKLGVARAICNITDLSLFSSSPLLISNTGSLSLVPSGYGSEEKPPLITEEKEKNIGVLYSGLDTLESSPNILPVNSQQEEVTQDLSTVTQSITVLEDVRKQLKTKGYLTQDSRVKERRKYGLKKARKASQYHKR